MSFQEPLFVRGYKTSNITERLHRVIYNRSKTPYSSFVLRALCSQIELVWVDGGYRGDDLERFVRKLWGWCWQVVLRTDGTKGFKVLPRRWVVERTFAWILHARRLSKDYEKNRMNSQSMVYLAMISVMAKKFK
jgi:putative transposase